jgi:prevent-host-death family protein
MVSVGVHEAKTHFSTLLRRVATGEEVVILNGGKPVAKLVPVVSARTRTLGVDRGKFNVPDDFNDPLPDAMLAAFQ